MNVSQALQELKQAKQKLAQAQKQKADPGTIAQLNSQVVVASAAVDVFKKNNK